MSNDWQSAAQCRGKATVFDAIANTRQVHFRKKWAASACAGCPVVAECARDALSTNAYGVVRAGMYLYRQQGSSSSVTADDQLRERLWAIGYGGFTMQEVAS